MFEKKGYVNVVTVGGHSKIVNYTGEKFGIRKMLPNGKIHKQNYLVYETVCGEKCKVRAGEVLYYGRI
jgi:hypothetical protein